MGRQKALRWLQTAERLRGPGLVQVKTDVLFDPLPPEPRFQPLERRAMTIPLKS